MHILVVYAHQNPASFSHAVLEEVERGLEEGGHTHEVLDLYAMGFDPVFNDHDATSFVHHTTPRGLLDRDLLARALLDAAPDPVRRLMMRRWLRGKTLEQLITVFEEHRPADVALHQAKVARAQGLVFIAPVFWMGFPAILKGWFERVFAYGFAYTLTPEGWGGDLAGRVPLLTQRKGLVLTPTFFTEEEYDRGWRDAMERIMCDWGLRMAGVQSTEHVYFYAVMAADADTRAGYLRRARELAKDF